MTDQFMMSSPTTGTLQQPQTLLLGVADVESLLTELAVLAPAVTQPSAPCGISLYRNGRPLPAGR